MPIRSVLLLIAGVIAAAFFSWYALTSDTFEELMEDNQSDTTDFQLSAPMIVVGVFGILFFPALVARIPEDTKRIRIVARIVWIAYFMLGILALLGIILALYGATQTRPPDLVATIGVILAAVALIAGAVSNRRWLGKLA